LRPPAFLRELFESIELSLSRQVQTVFTSTVPFRGIALRKISKIDQHIWLAPLGRAEGHTFWVLQWLVLCGIPYRDQDCASRCLLTLRTSFPLPSSGRPFDIRPPGGSTALLVTQLQLFESTTTLSHLQLTTVNLSLGCDLVRISTDPQKHNPALPVKKRSILWESRVNADEAIFAPFMGFYGDFSRECWRIRLQSGAAQPGLQF
jgi:hypothetical protein